MGGSIRGRWCIALAQGSILGLVGGSGPGAKRSEWGSVGHDDGIVGEAVLGRRAQGRGHVGNVGHDGEVSRCGERGQG